MSALFPLRASMVLVLGCLTFCTDQVSAQGPRKFLNLKESWFQSEEAEQIAGNILSYQAESGGWPKNLDTTAAPYKGKPEDLKPTFDNRATTEELRFLARMAHATGKDRYRRAFERGLTYILNAQYPTGGWPQMFPPPNNYQRHITFNDDAMVRLMEFLREVSTLGTYDFVSAEHRQAASQAFDRGVDCILKCQVKVDGRLTVWCAQHDEKDYRPRPARSFELVSLSGMESVGIVRLLMSLENPSPEVVQSIESAVAWFESTKLPLRVEVREDPNAPEGKDKIAVEDPNAPPIWARFSEIGTNRPIFADRDGVMKHHLSEIGYERRNGYAWLGDWPARILNKDYPAWKKKWSERIPQPE